MANPNLIVISGPNGAGKSTAAPVLLRDTLEVVEFVNADAIALGLSGFRPEEAAFQAGRVMLRRLKGLAQRRVDFAFETTLASRSFAPWIEGLKQDGYRFHLVFLWLPDVEMAIARVAERVRLGGHDIPQAVIRRRYEAGIRNFFQLYRPLADWWYFYDNMVSSGPRLIARGENDDRITVQDSALWNDIQGIYQ